MNTKQLFLLVICVMLSSLSYAQTVPPYYHINQINSVNANGVADSLGTNVTLRGVVHCIDFRAGTGLEFYLAEYNNTGIRVFDFTDVSGYAVTEGDSLEIRGTIGQFNGHLQIDPDSIIVHSTGNPLVMPMTVTQLNEATENKFISFDNAWLVDTMQWTNSGSGFNVDITNGTDTVSMRVDNATNLYGQPRPAEPFNVSGWAGQYDPSSPHNEGYQFFPCGLSSITIVPPLFPPYYQISQINSVDANGVADSLGAMVRVRGVVHCIDFRAGTGLEFYLAEYNNTGIRVFDFADVNGYAVTEGDSLEILGTISQFNGHLQIDPDSIIVHSTGNPLVMPMTVTQLNEATENKFISFDNAWLVDTMQWTNSGSGFNVDITNGTDTISMRVDNASNLYGQPRPAEPFNVSGWAGQYDPSSPHNEGYQFFPCGLSSITSASVDVAVTSFLNLDSTYCNVSTISGSVIITNMTANDATNVPYAITANGAPLAAGTIALLAGNASDTITVGPVPATTGIANILATTALTGDNNTSNDSLAMTVYVSNTAASANITTTISCNGDSTGQITAVGTNGIGTYNYAWGANTGNAATAAVPNLPAGTYMVTITDSTGCSDSATTTLTEPTVITPSIIDNNDGTATISATGGMSPYSFAWDSNTGNQTTSTATGLTNNSTYTVSVTDANNCVNTTMITISISTPVPSGSLIITEIMYNPPESGADSLEFIEIYNNSPTAINLNNYTLSGVNYTFPNVNLAASAYYVVAVDSAAFNTVYGVIANGIFTGGLSNNGEAIIIRTPAGTVVDSVRYDDGGAWINTPDGNGPSLILCDTTTDNADGNNWSASATSTGVTIEGNIVMASPGVSNTCPLPPVDVSVTSFLNLDTTYCNVSAITGSVIITNMTSNDVTNVPYAITANGLPLAIDSIPLLSGNSSDTITVGPIPASATGIANILATTILSGDNDTTNDSLAMTIYVSNTTASTSTIAAIACHGDSTGQIMATGTNGIGTYNYAWGTNTSHATTDTVLNLPAGTYNVTITDSIGCSDSATVILSEPTDLTLNYTLLNVLCKGDSTGSITVSPFGGTPNYSFMWSNGETNVTTTNLPAGFYNVTVTDANGCMDSTTAVITEPANALSASIIDNGNGTAVAVGTGGTGFYTFLWDAAAGNQITDTATALVHNGNYSVTITDVVGCTDTASVNINIISINYLSQITNLNLYPNPASNNVFVALDLEQQAVVEINITNTLGQLVVSKTLENIQNKLIDINTSNLQSGVYLVHFKINNEYITRKLTIK